MDTIAFVSQIDNEIFIIFCDKGGAIADFRLKEDDFKIFYEKVKDKFNWEFIKKGKK
ncbi:MAG: hypothetical protein WC783_03300 [Candidatus Paceibacterota bacterium]|jgi:hypothetical protein